MLPKNSEVDQQELLAEYDLARQEIAAIDQQIKQLQDHHVALLATKESLESVKGGKGSEILVPTGAGMYLEAQLNNDESFLINVGANILIEMNHAKASKTIGERVDQVLSMILKLNEEANMMMQRMQQIELMIYPGAQAQ